MTMNSRTMWLAGAGVAAALLVFLGWMLLISPQMDAAAASRTETEETRASNATLQTRVESLAADAANITALQVELDRLHAQFPTDLELSEFVRHLASMASDSGAVVEKVSRSEPAAREDLTTVWQVPVSLTVAGTHDQIFGYVDRLQSVDDRLFLVTAFSIASGTDAEMSGTITGYTFVLPESSGSTTADTAAAADAP
jgi:Tfp pilus assembly protein PilO